MFLPGFAFGVLESPGFLPGTVVALGVGILGGSVEYIALLSKIEQSFPVQPGLQKHVFIFEQTYK